MIKKELKLKCLSCGVEYDTTETVPDNVVSITCNWCVMCEDVAEHYYEENYVYESEKEIIQEADKRKAEYEKQVKLYSEMSSKVDQTITKIKDLKPF